MKLVKVLTAIAPLLMAGCGKEVAQEEVGPFVAYCKDGQKKMEANYKDGKQDGLSTHWYDNGQKEAEITYKDGKQDGLWIIYNQEGTETGRETYKNGELVKD